MQRERSTWGMVGGATIGAASLLIASVAGALPSQEVEPLVRYATEPSTGSMMIAALIVLATVGRTKLRSV